MKTNKLYGIGKQLNDKGVTALRYPILFVALFIISLIIRVKDLSVASLRNDELWTVWFSSERYIGSFQEMLHIANAKFFDVPPLYIVFMRFWIQMFGDGEFSIRLPSAIFGSLAIPLFYSVSCKFVSKKISLIATFLLIFLPVHIHYSQEARNYSLFFLLSLLSMAFYLKVIETEKHRYMIGYLLSALLMVYCHYFALFLIIIQSLYAFIRLKIKYSWIIVQIAMVLMMVPLAIPIAMRYFSPTGVVGSWIKRIGIGEGFTSELFFFSPYAKDVPINYAFITLFFIGVIRTVSATPLRKIGKNHLHLLWFMSPIIIPLVVSQFTKPFFVERYAIIALAPFMIYVSIGLESIIINRKLILLLLFLFVLLPFQQDRMRTPTENFEDWKKIAVHVSKDTIPVMVFPETPAARMGVEYYAVKTSPRIVSSLQINEAVGSSCEREFFLVSRYTDYKLDFNCTYAREKIEVSDPPYLFKYRLIER